jgi:hypothetical protein
MSRQHICVRTRTSCFLHQTGWLRLDKAARENLYTTTSTTTTLTIDGITDKELKHAWRGEEYEFR